MTNYYPRWIGEIDEFSLAQCFSPPEGLNRIEANCRFPGKLFVEVSLTATIPALGFANI
jgi:hypothetical protein